MAFDLDGTLYPNYRFYWRVLPSALKNLRLLRAFGRARDTLHHEAAQGHPAGDQGSFYEIQARYMGELLDKEPEKLLADAEKAIYRGWEPLFKKVKLFPYAAETLNVFREKGIKLALLSDFPPEQKIEHLKLSGLWDAVLCSEVIGRLKPHPLPFQKTAEALGFSPSEILYVGNSFRYDVLGAKNAGMKAAWIRPFPSFAGERTGADFVFYDYRQLRDFVLI